MASSPSVPTQELVCPRCGRALALTRPTFPDLWRLGWRPGATLRIVGPCGHGHVLSPWPVRDGRWVWVPTWGDEQ